MENKDFSEIQMALFSFLETRMKKTDLFKIKDKVDKKEKELLTIKAEKKEQTLEQLTELENQLKQQRQQSLLTEIPDWLTESANKAVSVGKPMFKNSHPTKFTNGDIEYGGIYIKTEGVIDEAYLTTETLESDYYDISQSNGNLITHSLFLMHKLDTESVYEKLEKADFSWLQEFAVDEQQVQFWGKNLKLWTGTQHLKSASGLKQSYFYLAEGNYHLLAPIFSSSLYQAIYERIRASKFDAENKKRRDAKRKETYCEGKLVAYPNLAIMNFGGTQPQNISVGNFVRHGQAYLLPCTPPQWQSSFKPPLNIDSIFDGKSGEFNRRAWKTAKNLKSYLIKQGWKDSNLEIRNERKQFIEKIIDILFDYAAEVQSLSEQIGWSESTEVKLKNSQKLWLDPYRKDKAFQSQRESQEWQQAIYKDFGLWLNKKLEHKKMSVAKIESDEWAKSLKSRLREFERDLEVSK